MRRAFIERLQEEYRDIAPVAARFSTMLAGELEQLLARDRIPLAVPLEHRVKAWLSIEDKLSRIRFHGASLAELHDLVGLRVILLFRRDVPRACELITKSFRVLGQHDKAEELSHDTFGYQSVHFVIRPRDAWFAAPTFAAFKDFQAEIQVRTLAQHMWAAASHKPQYNREDAIPQPIRRSIHRVSALLETIDLELERVLEERDAYRAGLHGEARSRPLNVDVLEALLDELFPIKNKESFEPYALLLWELKKLGIKTSGDLRRVVEKNRDAVLKNEADTVQKRQRYFDEKGVRAG